MSIQDKLANEIRSFRGIWKGGYCEGNPLDPVGRSSYGRLGYLSVLYVVYISCIKPYLTPHTRIIEIGPGRGCWTKCFINAKEIWCLDALPADYNKFWDYVGNLPEDYFDYFFTFGCFCHISQDGVNEYMKNLYSKLREGAHGFVMIGDYEKYNNLVEKKHVFDIGNFVFSEQRIIDKFFFGIIWKTIQIIRPIEIQKIEDFDDLPHPGRWYNYRTSEFCERLKSIGYTIIDEDCGVNLRDPVIHIKK